MFQIIPSELTKDLEDNYHNLTHKHLKINRCPISNVATDSHVLKHRAINNQYPQCWLSIHCTAQDTENITFAIKIKICWNVVRGLKQHMHVQDRSFAFLILHYLIATVELFTSVRIPQPRLNIKMVIPWTKTSIKKIRRSPDCPIFIMEIPILIRRRPDTETAPSAFIYPSVLLQTTGAQQPRISSVWGVVCLWHCCI